MKPSLLNSVMCLVILCPSTLWAAELKCTWDGRNPDARIASEYDITADEQGTLLSVDGKVARSIGADKYTAGGKTFWYYADNQRLRRYDAGVGNVFFDCH